MFQRLLIANRGEAALRVLRACHTLGIEGIVVYSEADRDAPWLEQADGAVAIGPARAEASYLNQDAILQAAEQSGCQAIHPGWGFLAENALFAARCTQQGLAFVGPPAGAMRRLGDKATARVVMAAAGLPVVPGSPGVLDGADAARVEAARIGYPVLLKASAGGGGRGLRRCASEAELVRAFGEASLEAQHTFGSGALYLERLIIGGRHVEFQLLCDAFGAAVHLGERDCSIQRRHQKLVEEAPSPAMDASTREQLGTEVARAVARAGYRSAGTVEFLRGPSGEFYFIEMNTRLQVEHPVTELWTGVDLVIEQLKVAANQPLDLTQERVAFAGHAIEFRINAEDPDDDFRPDPGTITRFQPPRVGTPGLRVRWDSAVREGYRIPPHYDSMIGKLIVHGPDREAALAAGREALESLVIQGVRTTIPLHLRLLDDPDFRAGRYGLDHLAARGLLRA